MSWYRFTGSVANGDTTVTGTLTAFLSQVKAEDAISFDGGGKWYEVASVTDNTHIELVDDFAETTVSGGDVIVSRNGRRWSLTSDVAASVAELLARYPLPILADAEKIWRVNSAGTAFELVALSGLGFALSSHTHDDRYYTDSEVDSLLSGKASTSHTHDDRYYTETEVDTLLSGKASTSHTHGTSGIDNDAVTYAKMQNVSATSRILGRKTSGAGDPEELTTSEALDFLGSTRGQVIFRGASGWQVLSPGTAGYVLQTGGVGADPSWVAAGTGSGDVSAASNFGTDNRLIRSDGPSKGVQASGVSLDDSDKLTSLAHFSLGTTKTSTNNASTLTPVGFFLGSGVAASLQFVRHTTPGAGGPQMVMSSTRGNDIDSYTAVQSGDGLGAFAFYGADGDQFCTGATLTAQVDGSVSNNVLPTRLIISTNQGGGNNATVEALRLDSAGAARFSYVPQPYTDNATTLGTSSYRWSTVYAATGTINTSDAREKIVDRAIDGDAALALVEEIEPFLFRWREGGTDIEYIDEVYEEQDQATEIVVETVTEIEVADGVARPVERQRKTRRAIFDEVPVVGADGEPLTRAVPYTDDDGKPAVREVPILHRVPRMETVSRTRRVPVATPRPGERLHAGVSAQDVRAALLANGLDCAAWGLDDKNDPDSRQHLRPDQMMWLLWSAVRTLAGRVETLEAALRRTRRGTHEHQDQAGDGSRDHRRRRHGRAHAPAQRRA